MASGKNLKALEKRYAAAILIIFFFSFFLTPLFNSVIPVFGIPLFVFMGVIAIPAVSIALTWWFRAEALKASMEGDEQR